MWKIIHKKLKGSTELLSGTVMLLETVPQLWTGTVP